MWFHPLQGVNEETPAGKVVSLILRSNGTLDRAPRPKRMAHGAPWFGRVGAKVRRAILAHKQARCLPSKCQIYHAVSVDCRLDRIRSAVFVQGQCKLVRTK
jgi:hypothetical protein